LAENRVGLSKGLIAEHGFSAWIEAGGKKILWDTGQGNCIAQNPDKLGVKIKEADLICLSHGHYDHTGGLLAALKMKGGGEVVCHPAAFEDKFARVNLGGKTLDVPIGVPSPRAALEEAGGRFTFLEERAEIAPGVFFFTGIPAQTPFEPPEPGFLVKESGAFRPDLIPDDACLAVVSDAGVSVILGCAHRGIVNTLNAVADRLGRDDFASIWGGTHMLPRSEADVEAAARALSGFKFRSLAAAHCTGFMNELKLAAALPGRFQFAAVGTKAEL
jgi:7,8-dihydropterin-6-yl-methyl-4-(beta-D-ribofuranosyl)aminobenzene 5'-phosphate synthase